MAKHIRTKRIHADRKIIYTSMRKPIRANYRSVGSYNNAMQSWRASMIEHISNNVSFGVRLGSRVLFVLIVIAFVFLLWNRSFDVQDFASGLVAQDFAPFDYEEFISEVDASFENLPSFLSGLKGIAQIFVSIGYSFFWVFGFLKYLIFGA